MKNTSEISQYDPKRSDCPAPNGITGMFAILLGVFLLFYTIMPVIAIEPTWTYTHDGSDFDSIALSSKGTFIAVGAGKVLFFSQNGKLLSKEPYGNEVQMTPDGKSVVSSYYNSIYFFRNPESTAIPSMGPEPGWNLELPTKIISLDISDDGKTIVASTESRGLFIYGSDGNLSGSSKRYFPVSGVSANGRTIEGFSQSGLTIFNKNGRELKNFDLSAIAQPRYLTISRNGDVSVINDDQCIRCIRTSNGSEIWRARARGEVTSMVIAPDGSVVVVGTGNGHIDAFDKTGNLTWMYGSSDRNKNFAVLSVAISDNGKKIVAGTSDGQIITLNSHGALQWMKQVNDPIGHIAISGDGSTTVATSTKTVYAFTSATNIASSPSNATIPATRTSQQNFSRAPVITPSVTVGDQFSSISEEPEPVEPTVTPPAEYSVVITPKKSPFSWSGVIVCLIVLVFFPRKR